MKKFGVTTGLANYAAGYATGLLCARRLLTNLGMDKSFKGAEKVDAEYYNVEDDYEGDRHPFRAVLDLGLTYTTTGNRVFGAMKGAVDGGLNIPHNTNRFPGSYKEEKNWNYDAEKHRTRIFGCHVDEYMTKLKDESKELFEKQFSQWSKTLKDAKVKTVEALY